MEIVRELFMFVRARRKFVLLPVLLMMLVFGGLLILTQGTAVAPFIYTLL